MSTTNMSCTKAIEEIRPCTIEELYDYNDCDVLRLKLILDILEMEQLHQNIQCFISK
jgi:hypothetical protein